MNIKPTFFNCYTQIDLDLSTEIELLKKGVYIKKYECRDYNIPFTIDHITRKGLIDDTELSIHVGIDKISEIRKKVKTKEDAEKYFNFIFEVYAYNPLLIDEILLKYKNEKNENEILRVFDKITNIELQLSLASNPSKKILILEEQYSKYSKILYSNKLYSEYFSLFKKTEIYTKSYDLDDDFIHLIKHELNLKFQIVEDFICDEFTYEGAMKTNFEEFDDQDLYDGYGSPNHHYLQDEIFETKKGFSIFNYPFFMSFKEIEMCFQIIEFLEDYKNENLSDFNPSPAPRPKKDIQYFSRVFVGENSENILFSTLAEFNVLTKNGHADNGFQSICESFWRVGLYNTFKDKIFKRNVKKLHFINHLNEKYEANIKASAKGTLSYKEENDFEIETFIKTYLNL